MDQTAFWVIGLIILFVLGSIFGLKVSPREKALGMLRDKARKMSLHPRLVPAPDWTQIPKASETRASMVAYYSILIPEGRLALFRAVVNDHCLQVKAGNQTFDGQSLALKGIYAIDMQANCVGIYWDEAADYHGEQLEEMKQYLTELAQQAS